MDMNAARISAPWSVGAGAARIIDAGAAERLVAAGVVLGRVRVAGLRDGRRRSSTKPAFRRASQMWSSVLAANSACEPEPLDQQNFQSFRAALE